MDNGVATVKGMVATDAQKRQAGRLATVTGITRVDNQVVVDKAADMNLGAEVKDVAAKTATKTKDGAAVAVDKTKDAAKTVGEKTKDGAVVVADKTKDAAKTVGEKTKDGAVVVADKTKDAAKTVGEKTKDGAVVVADKTKAAVSKTGEVITDAWITTKLKADFVNEDTLKGSDINVDTNNHVVTLKGTVKTTAGRDRAVQIAKTTDGVSRVVNQLVIGTK